MLDLSKLLLQYRQQTQLIEPQWPSSKRKLPTTFQSSHHAAKGKRPALSSVSNGALPKTGSLLVTLKRQTSSFRADSLPLDVLLHIFTQLPPAQKELATMMAVSRNFHSVALSPCLWTKLMVTLDAKKVDSHPLGDVRSSLTAALSRCTNLRLLGFSSDVMDDISAVNASCCVRSLDLSSSTCLDRGSIAELLSCVPQLEHLDLSGHFKLTDEDLEELATLVPYLVSLNLSSCSKLTDHSLEVISKHLPKIQRLEMRCCRKLLGLQAAVFPLLSKLDLSHCMQISDDSLASLAPGLPNLSQLDLFMCRRVGDLGLCSVVRHCPSLKTLDLGWSNVGMLGLSQLPVYAKELRHISLVRCPSVTEPVLQDLRQVMVNLQCTPETWSNGMHM